MFITIYNVATSEKEILKQICNDFFDNNILQDNLDNPEFDIYNEYATNSTNFSSEKIFTTLLISINKYYPI